MAGKELFVFEYTMPSLDWYEIIKVEIDPEKFYYFGLELRAGNDWWLIGMNPPDSNSAFDKWSEKCLGRLTRRDAARFAVWAGRKLIRIGAISGALDLVKETETLIVAVKEVGRRLN